MPKKGKKSSVSSTTSAKGVRTRQSKHKVANLEHQTESDESESSNLTDNIDEEIELSYDNDIEVQEQLTEDDDETVSESFDENEKQPEKLVKSSKKNK